MQKTNQSNQHPSKSIGGMAKVASAQNGGTKGHSKPGSGGTHAGPPPPPKPQVKS